MEEMNERVEKILNGEVMSLNTVLEALKLEGEMSDEEIAQAKEAYLKLAPKNRHN
jgi:hypothetical protein